MGHGGLRGAARGVSVVTVRRGDCWWAELGPTLGHEQSGLRPVLVVSVERVNRRGLLLAVPLTTKKALQFPLAVDLGLVGDKQAFALPAQLRALSVLRLKRCLEQGREADVERCLEAFLQLCGRLPAPLAANDGGAP